MDAAALAGFERSEFLGKPGLTPQDFDDPDGLVPFEAYVSAWEIAVAAYEVAFLLGYSEPSAFHRAFRRWTGVTPQEFRRRATAADERVSQP